MKKSRQNWLVRKWSLYEEKKPHEHKYSVTFVRKVGTIIFNWTKERQKLILQRDCKLKSFLKNATLRGQTVNFVNCIIVPLMAENSFVA